MLDDQVGLDDVEPIDLVESVASVRKWDFERLGSDKISMVAAGQWRSYQVLLSWSDFQKILRLTCTFEIVPAKTKRPMLFETINLCNEMITTGAFYFCEDQQKLIFRYGFPMRETGQLTPRLIDTLIANALRQCDRFYPAFQLAIWSSRTPKEALNVAIAEAYGHA